MELIERNTQTLNFNDVKLLSVIKQTLASDASDAEFKMFIEFCKSTGLNPFKKELWFIKAGGRVQIMTGINGFFSIANNHPAYDGIESGLINKNGEYMPQTYALNDFIGAWCKVYRKDRKMPSEGVAMLSEYEKTTPIWKQMKRVMILKCAESVGLRKAFPQELNGLYTVEEMPKEYENKETINVTPNFTDKTDEIDIETGEVIEKKYRPEAKSASAGKKINIDWSQFKYKYHLPVSKEGHDMQAVRDAIKAKGWKFRGGEGGDNCWYTNDLSEKLEEYMRENTEYKEVIQNNVQDDDDLPF